MDEGNDGTGCTAFLAAVSFLAVIAFFLIAMAGGS